MVDLKSYVPMIDAILSAANPDQATPKRIRKALQELFAVDLDSRRKDVNKIIVERFQESQERPKRLVSYEELRKQDEATTRRLLRGPKKRTKSSSPSKKKKTGEGSSNYRGFNRTKVILAKPLSDILGETESTRTQVVKSLWDYIKRNNLQNPEDRREILCDEKMKPIFGDKVSMFSMNKTLSKYIHNAADITSSKHQSQDEDEDETSAQHVGESRQERNENQPGSQDGTQNEEQDGNPTVDG